MIKKFIILIICTVLFLFVCESIGTGIYGQTVWTWQPGADGVDARIYEKFPDTNYGGEDEIGAGNAPAERIRSVLWFVGVEDSVSGIVDSAFVDMEGINENGADLSHYFAMVTETYVKGTVTWNTPTVGGPTSSSPYSDTVLVDAVESARWDVTDIVKEWVENGTTNYGFFWKTTDETQVGSYDYFNSSEVAAAGDRPMITVYSHENELTGILPKVYQGTIQPKVDAGTIIPKVRSPE